MCMTTDVFFDKTPNREIRFDIVNIGLRRSGSFLATKINVGLLRNILGPW